MTTKRHKAPREADASRRARPRPLSVAVSQDVLKYLTAMGAAHGNLTADEMAADLLSRHVERKLIQELKKGEPLFSTLAEDDALFLVPESAEAHLRADNLSFQRISARQDRSEDRLARLLASEADPDV